MPISKITLQTKKMKMGKGSFIAFGFCISGLDICAPQKAKRLAKAGKHTTKWMHHQCKSFPISIPLFELNPSFGAICPF